MGSIAEIDFGTLAEQILVGRPDPRSMGLLGILILVKGKPRNDIATFGVELDGAGSSDKCNYKG